MIGSPQPFPFLRLAPITDQACIEVADATSRMSKGIVAQILQEEAIYSLPIICWIITDEDWAGALAFLYEPIGKLQESPWAIILAMEGVPTVMSHGTKFFDALINNINAFTVHEY